MADSENSGEAGTAELIAKAIAPVKAEFLRPPPTRTNNKGTSISNHDANGSFSSLVMKEKKSRRQIKRERHQNSALRLCPEIAKTGVVSSCSYNDNCHFSHDLEAFWAQKPADLDGKCPFMTSNGGTCPYGLACRFFGSHEDNVSGNSLLVDKKISEMNGLNKDVQKLLWKNNFQFPKAHKKLELLGLMGPGCLKWRELKKAVDQIVVNDSQIKKNVSDDAKSDVDAQLEPSSEVPLENLAEERPSNELRPPKKVKLVPDGITDAFLAQTDSLKIHPRERKLIDFNKKLYLAPLTTVGNLPFRRICKVLGADVTCGEMAMCSNILQGQASEWALLRRHLSEDLFGVQICGAYPDTLARAVELVDQECVVDFIDINMGCPIDVVVNKGAGSSLLTKSKRIKNILVATSSTVETPITVKVRTGFFQGENCIDSLISDISNWGAHAITIHGRSRQQRYSKLANWDYTYQCAREAPGGLQVLGNGDIFSYTDWNKHMSDCPQLASCMIARGALIKPWIFTEIKEQRHWDISSGERFNILKDYVHFGLEHWGSNSKGVETTRRFLLEWLSHLCRYIPVALLDVVPQHLNWRKPSYCGRDDLETLMASDSAADWIQISEMLLGKVPDGFTFAPKHKSNNACDRQENG